MDGRFQHILDAAFPPETDEAVVRGVQEGILLADTLLQSDSILKTLVGRDLRGHLRRAGVLYRLHDMAVAGDIPFAADMVKMPKGGWHFVELRSGNLKAHICRSESPSAFPEDTPVRQDARLTNQPDFFKPVAVEDVTDRYAWLTYGAGDSGALGHVCWGMPSAAIDVWLARTNIIIRLKDRAVEVRPDRGVTTFQPKFRDHIKEALDASDEDRKTK